MSRLALSSKLSYLRNRHFLAVDIVVLIVIPLIALLLRLDSLEKLALIYPRIGLLYSAGSGHTGRDFFPDGSLSPILAVC